MYYGFGDYVSVAQKQKQAEKLVEKLRLEGRQPKPVPAFKGKLASTFWGKSWCDNLESYADYESRLGRGRSYVRSGCVCHLDISNGVVQALVSGSALYTLTVRVAPLEEEFWRAVCATCAGQVGSLLELLQGKISQQVMAVMCDPATGIFPSPKELSFDCSCPDWASMCKHVAAALYGIGRRLDTEPELLFVLRGVDAADLIPKLDFSQSPQAEVLANDDLGGLFGIDLDMNTSAMPPDAAPPPAQQMDTLPLAGKKPPCETTPEISTIPNPTNKKHKEAPFKPHRPTGAAIRKLRALSKLRPADFARALGVTLVTLLRWEKSKGILGLRESSKEALLNFQSKLLHNLQWKKK